MSLCNMQEVGVLIAASWLRRSRPLAVSGLYVAVQAERPTGHVSQACIGCGLRELWFGVL